MEIDINDFRQRLESEKAKGKTEVEIAAFIYNEIRTTENTKAGLMEEMNESNKDFLNDAATRIDAYIFELQEIEKAMNLQSLHPDQQIALNDALLRHKIADEMETLNKINPEKYPEQKDPENQPKD